MRKAKIICTLGPATDPPGRIEALIRAGMDMARVNFSHGTWEEHRARIERVRKASRALGRPVAVLQDVQGPKIRLGRFEGGKLLLQEGETVTLTTERVVGRSGLIPTPLRSLPRDVQPGDPVLLNDGRVRLEVVQTRGQRVTCRVQVGGWVGDHKGLNLPRAPVSTPALTPKDVKDLAFGQEMRVDYVALSFVRTAADIERARRHVRELKTPLIAKVEKPQAVEAIDAIARAADGVMVARGDLGVEMPLERLPHIQKDLVKRANTAGAVTIVATEMLESMTQNPRPTRAEVTDVANAIWDGADAVMLSGETAVGQDPAGAAATMARIVEEAEGAQPACVGTPYQGSKEISVGVAAAAVAASRQLEISTLIAYTETGHTAKLISEFRPSARIVALTPNAEMVNRMQLYWGVTALPVTRHRSVDAMVEGVRKLCREDRLCTAGTPVVLVAGVPLNRPGNTNVMTVVRI